MPAAETAAIVATAAAAAASIASGPPPAPGRFSRRVVKLRDEIDRMLRDGKSVLPAAASVAQASSRAQALLEIDSVIKLEGYSDMSAEDKAEIFFTWGLGALPRFGEGGGLQLGEFGEEYQELTAFLNSDTQE